MSYAIGQRWISDTESDLGLGTVVNIEGRMVTILFTATGEQRLYSMSEAPITRVLFNPGDTIQSAEGWSMVVEHIDECEGLVTYIGIRQDTQESDVQLREVMLDHFFKMNKPQDRLFSGQIDRFDWYVLRQQCWANQHQHHQSPLRGLIGSRASLIPHQLHIAEEVGKRYAPRVLLSDEVGLGKTVEAGMIIHQQIISGLSQRVLIVVPESLQHQWLVEMIRRFNLHFSIFDDERCTEAFAESSNPFETEQLVITSMEFLSKKKRWFEQATLAEWDLLVVDEAHHLVCEESKPNTEYRRVEDLAKDTDGLILLTATPDQLGHESHFARLKLLDPDRFYDYNVFVEEEKHYNEVAEAANELLVEKKLSDKAVQTIQALLKESDISHELNTLTTESSEPERVAQAKQSLIQQLLDRHGTGRILFRNSRSGVEGFPERIVNPHPVELPSQYKTAISVSGQFSNGHCLEQKAIRALFPEQIYQEFEGENATWWHFDPRVEWLIDTLKSLKEKKVLVICAHAQTALTLEQALRDKEAIRAAVFHEGMSLIERDKAAAYFAQDEDSAQVLLCSEIGSEGRNFQFAHHLVLFDLPLNPDLLEQRIGRLDRIGQTESVQIHIPYFSETSQELLFHWYHEGLEAFEHTCATGSIVYKEYGERLLELLSEYSSQEEESHTQLIHDANTKHHSLKKALEEGRDRLLELNSSGRGAGEKLADAIETIDNETHLATFMLKVFDVFGINQDDKGDNAIVLTPSEHMLMPTFPCLRDDGITVTFDRDTALSQEDMHFITWDHPMVQGAIDLFTGDELGSSSVALLNNKALPAGTFFVELMYVAEVTAPSELQISRYLPHTPIRLLLDKSGKDLSANVPFDTFNRQLKPVGRQTGSKLVAALQSVIHNLLPNALTEAEKQLSDIQEKAKGKVHQALDAELERLQALKQMNPNVRDDEIWFLNKQKTSMDEFIMKTQLKLDAIRLIVVSHG
ncbi:RNA polymerase-associated protein RapA [Algicola sagamiensis]|uniref:RNA polymerase-associated protein RapA n=1 Tax=Algicola sagamiensis TaxID=163869 RepID=UPI00037764D4|nr:RNA polymerase-associated protein RapA [Algicola sagamiensis]